MRFKSRENVYKNTKPFKSHTKSNTQNIFKKYYFIFCDKKSKIFCIKRQLETNQLMCSPLTISRMQKAKKERTKRNELKCLNGSRNWKCRYTDS